MKESIPLYQQLELIFTSIGLTQDFHFIILQYYAPSYLCWEWNGDLHNRFLGDEMKNCPPWITPPFEKTKGMDHQLFDLQNGDKIWICNNSRIAHYYERDTIHRQIEMPCIPQHCFLHPDGHSLVLFEDLGFCLEIHRWSPHQSLVDQYTFPSFMASRQIRGVYQRVDQSLCVISGDEHLYLYELRTQKDTYFGKFPFVGWNLSDQFLAIPTGFLIYSRWSQTFQFYHEERQSTREYKFPGIPLELKPTPSYLYLLCSTPTVLTIWRRRLPLCGRRRWKVFASNPQTFPMLD